jgi:hypothetical protein
MAGLTNEELGLDENGFPPTDKTGNVDLEQIEYNLSLTPQQRLEQYFDWMEFIEGIREAGRDFYGMETRIAEESA